MRYMDVREASEKWGISDRRIRVLCNEGRIDGAIKLNWSWTIPENAPKPRDGRVLRKFRNLDIRPGSVDIMALDAFGKEYPAASVMKNSEVLNSIISESLCFLLEEASHPIDKSSIEKVLTGSLVPELSLEDHLIIVNFKSILISLSECSDRWFEKDVKESYVRLMQGISDRGAHKYRDGFAKATPRSDEEVRVDVQMETLLTQYETSWRNLHGLIGGVLLYGEIVRIKPFGRFDELLAYLVLAGEFLRGNILPPTLTSDSLQEAKAALSLAIRRGTYADFTHYIERAVYSSYKVAANV